MFTPPSPRIVPDAPDHAGHVSVAQEDDRALRRNSSGRSSTSTTRASRPAKSVACDPRPDAGRLERDADRARVVPRLLVPGLADREAALTGDEHRVDVVDDLRRVRLERALRRCHRDRMQDVLGQPPRLDREPHSLPAESCDRNRAERSASRIQPAAPSASFGPRNGRFTAGTYAAPASASSRASTVCVETRSCASCVDAPRCGVATTCGASGEGRPGPAARGRKRRGPRPPGGRTRAPRRAPPVHEAAARDVDEDGPRLHARDLGGAEERPSPPAWPSSGASRRRTAARSSSSDTRGTPISCALPTGR